VAKKKKKKAAAKKKAAPKKKAAKKKAAVVTKKGGGKKKSGKKKEKSDKIEVEATPMSDADVAVHELKEVGIADFKNPMEMTVSKLEKEAQKLYKSRVGDEFKLSFTLFALVEKNAPADRGYETKDYFTRFLGISHTKANEMVANARFLIDMGVTNLKTLIGLSWPKVKLLRSPVNKGVISKRNLESWLKKCQVGENGTAEWDLEKQIKDLIAKKAKVDLDDSLKNFSFKAPAYTQDVVNRFEEIAEKAFGGDRGNWYIQALSLAAASLVNKADADLLRAKGLAALKEMAEKISPVAAIFVPLTDEVGEDVKLGLVSRIFQGFSEDRDGVKELRFCFAGTEAEAKKFLKVKEVRPFPIEVSKSIAPAEIASIGSVEEAEEGEEEELSDDDLKEGIKDLVAEKKVAKEVYKKKKAALLKKHEKGRDLNLAIYAWLKSYTPPKKKKGAK
jgi:hypothetical protein